MMIRPNRIGRRWLGIPAVTPRSLFLNSEDGLVFDFSNPAALYTDAAGTVPLTAPGQTIGLAADKSRPRSPITAYAGVQASAGLRPTYGRAPKSVRQRLSGNSQVNSGWTGAGTNPPVIVNNHTHLGEPCVSVTFTDAMADGYAGSRAENVASVPITAGKQYVTSVYASLSRTLAVGELVIIYFTGTSALSNMTINSANSASLVGGFTRIFGVPITPALTGADNLRVFCSATTSDVTVYINRVQVEIGAVVTDYQPALSAFELTEAGQPQFGYTRLDGADDKFTVTLPSAITGDVLLFGRNGSWIEEGVTLPAGALSLGPTGTLATAGILRVIGDLVGVVIIGRPTTATERALALRYFAARGAAGWLVAGAEMVTNGGFDTDLTGWTNENISRGVSTWEAGAAKLDNTGAGNTIMWQSRATVIGQAYVLRGQLVSKTAANAVLFPGTASTGGGGYSSAATAAASADLATVFVATTTTTYLAVAASVAVTGHAIFDNISLKPLNIGA